MSWLWMLKAAGSLLIITGSTMVGFTLSRRLTERLELIREVQVFLLELENEIHYMGLPLGRALLSYSSNKSGEMAKFTKQVSELHIRRDMTIEAAWQKSLEQFRELWPIHREEWTLLMSVGEVLGKTDKAGQSAFIQMMRDKFSVQEKKAEEERARKEKLYKSLGTLGGLALVLVLV